MALYSYCQPSFPTIWLPVLPFVMALERRPLDGGRKGRVLKGLTVAEK